MIKLSPAQRALFSLIKRRQPILAGELSQLSFRSERQMRRRIKELRRLGIGILPTHKGYIVSNKANELYRKSEAIRSQGLSMLRTAKDLKTRALGKANARLTRSK